MRLSLAAINVALDPNLIGFVKATALNSSRAAVDATNPAGITDNSGGAPAANLVPVPTVDAAAVPAGANLAQLASFNAGIEAIDDALAVLAQYLKPGYSALGLDPDIGDHGGDVAIAGTVPAVPDAVTGVDGTAGDAVLRAEVNAAIVRQRNNLSTVVRVYNVLAAAVGVTSLEDRTLGKAAIDLTYAAQVDAATVVAAGDVATSDLASKAAVDAAFNAFQDNIATLATKIDDVLYAAGTLGAVEAIVLMP